MSQLAGFWNIQESLVTVNPGASGTQLCTRNAFRFALEIACAWPPAATAQVGSNAGLFFAALVAGVNLGLGGVVVLQQAMDSQKGGRLEQATAQVTGGGTVALQLVRGANTITLGQTTTTFQLTAPVELLANDTITWNNTVGALGSTADLYLGGLLYDQWGVSLSTTPTADRTQGHRLTVDGPPTRYDYRNYPAWAQSAWFASNLSTIVRQQVLVRELLLVQ